MTILEGAKPIKRQRQRITRTACEPCREKQAKCDGERPCDRCETRNLDCHFTQRTWVSKRSLQDEAASLREQVSRRDYLLNAICGSDDSGEDIVRMLRDSGLSYDQAYESVRGSDAGSVTPDTTMGYSDCETTWSPSTVNSNLPSSTSSQNPVSFLNSTIDNGNLPRPLSNTKQQQPQQPGPFQQQMNTPQSIPWAASASTPDVNPFGNIFDPTSPAQPLLSDIASDGRTVIDPMLWPPINSFGPFVQPIFQDWFSLMADPTDRRNSGSFLPCESQNILVDDATMKQPNVKDVYRRGFAMELK